MADALHSPAEVRKLADVTPKQLRYWRLLHFIVPKETKGKHTRYTDADVWRMRLCAAFQRKGGLTLHQAITAVRVVEDFTNA